MKIVDGLLLVLTIVFIESDSVIEDEEAEAEQRERCEFVQAQVLYLISSLALQKQ